MVHDRQETHPEQMGDATVAALTADIVSAYVSHNTISPAQLPELIKGVSDALKG